MKDIRKITITALITILTLQLSIGQEIKFVPQPSGELDGTAYRDARFGDNGLLTIRTPAKGGIDLKLHYVDVDAEEIISYDVTDLMKKKLVSYTQLYKLKPILIGNKLYMVENSKSYKDVTLIGRNEKTLEFTGEEISILNNDEKTFNYDVQENSEYFSFYDVSWAFEREKPFVIKAFVFEKANLKNVLKVNHGVKEGVYQDILSLGITKKGSFYTLSTPFNKGKDKDPNLRSSKIRLELHQKSGKQELSYEFTNGGVIGGSTVIEDDNGTYIRVIRVLAQGGIIISILEVKDGELIEKSYQELPYETLYEGNENDNVVNFRQRIKEKKDGIIEMVANVGSGDDHRLSDGSYVSVISMSINEISVLLILRMNTKGEMVWTKCLPANEIITTGVDNVNELHIFLNDARSHYNEAGDFISYSNTGRLEDKLPVHISVNVKGEVTERKVLTDGFKDQEKFDHAFSRFNFVTDGVILTAKSKCQDAAGNTCYSFTLGTINLNP